MAFHSCVFFSSRKAFCVAAKYGGQRRAELAEKQLKLIEREKELLDKDQTVSTLREEVSVMCQRLVCCLCMYTCMLPRQLLTLALIRLQLDLERKLRALLTKEKDKAEEQAALSMGLCTGAFTLP